ncbi:hypothetical protein LIN78_02025 [Leeia sp. TBRC 13508]|uniref:Uncharacterized protein n=1 Tax=Leeia speluncae TaxID=2884804 RepID=A0ABS8D2A7_9NEIS|nr:hypothetical protein [Leeia speluncae]MCB6182333.1 hypothetical protein [Leeia speluncae]
MNIKQRLPIIGGITVGVLVFFYMNSMLSISREPETVEQAQEAISGTWTYTDPININDSNQFPEQWVKYVIDPNGSMQVFYASPSDSSWGHPQTCPYKVTTGKYSDTGERWFGIRSVCDSVISVLYKKGNLVLHHLSYEMVGKMEKGDKFPFSK